LTYSSEKLRPPKAVEDPRDEYRWRYRVFELLNGIQTILGTGVEVTAAGVITETTLQGVIGQLNTLIAALQAADTALTAADAAHVAAADPHTGYLTQSEGDAAYAPITKGVTNGDTHDHSGGDGAQINHTALSNIGTNTHAQIDAKIATLTGLAVHANNTAALGSGLVAGDFYRTGADPDVVCVVH